MGVTPGVQPVSNTTTTPEPQSIFPCDAKKSCEHPWLQRMRKDGRFMSHPWSSIDSVDSV